MRIKAILVMGVLADLTSRELLSRIKTEDVDCVVINSEDLKLSENFKEKPRGIEIKMVEPMLQPNFREYRDVIPPKYQHRYKR